MFSYEKSFEEFVAHMSPKPMCLCKPALAPFAEHGTVCPIGYAREAWSANGRAMWAEIKQRELDKLNAAAFNADFERAKLNTAMARGSVQDKLNEALP
jgi:hypothetical protein